MKNKRGAKYLIPDRALKDDAFTSVEFFKDEFKQCFIDYRNKKINILLTTYHIHIEFESRKKLVKFCRHLSVNLCAPDSNRLPTLYIFQKDVKLITFITQGYTGESK